MARVVVPGMPHHITQRGSRRSVVFQDESDRFDYLNLFTESCRQFHLRIVAYCLMTNHVHYIAIPDLSDSIYRVFHRSHGTYSKRFNKKYGFVGHLWQERPYSCVLDEAHFWNGVRYVEQNPVRARMIRDAADYPWSSAAAHCRDQHDSLLDVGTDLKSEIHDWASWLGLPLDETTQKFIRESTFTGRPCGDEAFVKRMEETTERELSRKKPGPKRKAKAENNLLLDWTGDRFVP
jgi:putative transposase